MWGRNQISIREPVQSAFVPNTFLVASARRDERESGESCPGDETRGKLTLDICPRIFSLLKYDVCNQLIYDSLFGTLRTGREHLSCMLHCERVNTALLFVYI